MLRDCFYTDKDKTLFYVAGYIQADNTDNLEDIINSLTLYKDKFIKEFKLSNVDIKTRFIEKACKYKYMRVFYVTDIEFDESWSNVYRIEEYDWTMNMWLRH